MRWLVWGSWWDQALCILSEILPACGKKAPGYEKGIAEMKWYLFPTCFAFSAASTVEDLCWLFTWPAMTWFVILQAHGLGCESLPRVFSKWTGLFREFPHHVFLVLGSQTFTPSARLTSGNIQTGWVMKYLSFSYCFVSSPTVSSQTKDFCWSWKWDAALDNLNPSGRCSLWMELSSPRSRSSVHPVVVSVMRLWILPRAVTPDQLQRLSSSVFIPS